MGHSKFKCTKPVSGGPDGGDGGGGDADAGGHPGGDSGRPDDGGFENTNEVATSGGDNWQSAAGGALDNW